VDALTIGEAHTDGCDVCWLSGLEWGGSLSSGRAYNAVVWNKVISDEKPRKGNGIAKEDSDPAN
jgi:hypothetical protein